DSVLAARGPARLDELSLTLVTDRTQTRGRDLVDVVRECLADGLPAVQVREKDLGAADRALLCRRLRELTRDAGARLLRNDRRDHAGARGRGARGRGVRRRRDLRDPRGALARGRDATLPQGAGELDFLMSSMLGSGPAEGTSSIDVIRFMCRTMSRICSAACLALAIHFASSLSGLIVRLISTRPPSTAVRGLLISWAAARASAVTARS